MTEVRRQRLWWDVGVPIVLLLAALLPRVVAFGALTNPDELKWLDRSVAFYDALHQGDWGATLGAFHPGIVPAWGFGAALCARYGLGQLRAWQAAGALPLADLARTALLFPIFLSALTVLAGYGLVRRLAGREVAFYGALLLALEPYYLAFGHAIHLDLTQASLMIMAALLWLNYLQRPRRWPYLLGSGVVAGLAFLTRTAALYLIPFGLLSGGLYFLADNLTGRGLRLRSGWGRWLGRTALAWLAWLLLWALALLVLWPAMWVEPGAVLGRLGQGILRSVENPHAAPVFFRGQVMTADPGVLYYVLILLFRLRPLTLFLAALNPLLLVLNWRRLSPQKRAAWLAGLAYGVFYFLQMSLAPHKLERYLLPLVPQLCLLAGVSLWQAVRWLAGLSKVRWFQGMWRTVAVGLLVVLLAVPWLRLAPYYAAYFNPLAGGGEKAQELFIVGGGLGLDLAAAYLNDQPDAEDLWALSFYPQIFGPYFVGHAQSPAYASWDGLPLTAHYVVVTSGQVQRHLYPTTLAFFRPRQPEHTVRLNGIEYAWIYPVPRRELSAPPPILHPVEADEANFEGRVRLLGYNMGRTQDALLVTLYWQPFESAHQELRVGLRLVDDAGQVRVEQSDPPWAGEGGVLTWPGTVAVQGVHRLVLPPDLPPGDYRLLVSLAEGEREGGERPWLLAGSQAAELDLGPVTVGPPPTPSQPVVEGNLGGLVRLVGYDPAPPLQVAAGATLPLTLTWEALAPMADDYTVFVHLTGGDGRPLAQADGPPLAGTYPTSFWKVRERLADSYLLAVPAGVPAGEYELRVGMYLLATGERLPLLDAEGQVVGDHIPLGPVTVTSP